MTDASTISMTFMQRLGALLEHPETPVDGELWDQDRLERHGRSLAESSGGLDDVECLDLRRRLRDNARTLKSAYHSIVVALGDGRAITPAAQWIVDNFHVISEQLDDGPLQVTPSLWRRLPRAGHADAVGWPRIHHIATEYLRHTLWEFNPQSLSRFLEGYQSVRRLSMAEIWALYPVLRLALVDELRCIASRVEDSLSARAIADRLADAVAHDHGKGSDLQRNPQWPEGRLTAPFVVQLAHRLQGAGERGRPLLEAISSELAGRGSSIDDYIQRQHARRSANNVAARNSITSLRALASFDWRTLFESNSHVEALLLARPEYLACDRRTRDRYRDAIAEIATNTGRQEYLVTEQILALLTRHAPADSAVDDLGSWLIGPQRPGLEAALDCPVNWQHQLRRWVVQHARPLYFGGIAAFTLGLTVLALNLGTDWQSSHALLLLLLATLAAFPVSEFVVGILNREWLRAFPPRHLPRVALEAGVQPEMKTLVVLPTLFRTPDDAVAACRQLQIHALANPDRHICFALLSDWTDSPTEMRVGDEAVLEAARRNIALLNRSELASEHGEPKFFLLHRRRQWSKSEGCFMGWERKRGKLEELNRLLLKRGDTSFLPGVDGLVTAPQGVRYVLTVDADTRLPLGSVRDLVGTAAHPLNRPVVSPSERRVVQGYGVLQPRITPLLPGIDERSLYREIVTRGSGVDPYAAAASDLHQDVFGEGLFTGKGIYDLAAWEAVLHDRVPPESLLSHDLFEGLFARCGLVSDIELFEDFPSHSEVAAARSHRWLRGDWQLLPWLVGMRGALPPLGRWKMFDNLRRSLLAPCSIALIIAAFAHTHSRPWVWILIVLAPAIWPALSTAIERLIRTPAAQSRRMHLYRLMADLGGDLVRGVVSLALLAQNAWLAIDAISRALFRLLVSRRHLLEWTTAAQVKAARRDVLASFVWPLKSASIMVVGAVAVMMATNAPTIMLFSPLLLLWWLSPIVAQFLSRPLDAHRPEDDLPEEVERDLRATARLTWTFFETHVTAEDHFLPPDNFQEDPVPVLAHRSSPTNFGLYLLSTVAARDFGWIGLLDMTHRLQATLGSLQKLERFDGHFLNWYDTRSLTPLAPRYVSTVDSGNLAGHLLTLRRACIAFRNEPLLSPRAFTGALDAVTNCRRALVVLAAGEGVMAGNARVLLDILPRLEQRIASDVTTLADARDALASALRDISVVLEGPAAELPAEVTRWLRVASSDLDSHLQELLQLPSEVAIALPRNVTLAQLTAHTHLVAPLIETLDNIAEQCRCFVENMAFDFLYERTRGLFSIGYRIADRALDEGYYDLLASEARLASLVAIAKGDVPRSHWFRLGRRLTGGSQHPALASWSGSMFEYLMPALVMHEPRYSLLEQTNRRVVNQHMRYGEQHGLPWGISESAYNVRDREYTYQYSGFGVPGLGLKRGLAADYVVAPYASALAAMVCPVDAHQNLERLARMGGRGPYGYYEALDYTASRVPEGKSVAVVCAYMAHHQGMSLVALDNVLQSRIMQSRFHGEPCIAAVDLLLQERCVRFIEAPVLVEAEMSVSHDVDEAPDLSRTVEGHASPVPVTHLLSNRHYTVMITDSGTGYSSCRGRAVTRWREDATADNRGTFIYLRDMEKGRVWSAGFLPSGATPDEYRVHFNEECATFVRSDGVLCTTTTVVVAPDDDGELRRVTLRNDSNRARLVELTSCAEIVLAPQRADMAHPAFSNLFVQTEFDAQTGALLANRRPRSDHETPVWLVHMLVGAGIGPGEVQYETDRARFSGRANTAQLPQAMAAGRALSNTVGNVLDPVFSLRTRVVVPPRGSVTTTFATFVATSREQALALVAKYRTPALFEHILASAWTFTRAELYYLRSDLREARVFQSLATHLLLNTRKLRAPGEQGLKGVDVTHLWRFSISGDRPILLVRTHSLDDLPFIQQCLRAQEYLRMKRFLVDVVILNERRHSYMQDLQNAIERTARAFMSQVGEGEERGGIYPLVIDAVGESELQLLLSLARVVLDPVQGGLTEQLMRPAFMRTVYQQMPQADGKPIPLLPHASEDSGGLKFFNGWGGFSPDGREYVISLSRSPPTPAPWVNVIANEQFGSLVTERGSMCTWSLNSRENQLTPWSNDAVVDPSGECFYLLGDDGELWSPAAQPVRRADAQYDVRHGQGYTHFDVSFDGYESRMTVMVAPTDPVKICQLKITNHLPVARRLTFIAYVEWALGAVRGGSNHNIQTQLDSVTGAHFASNPALIDFGSRVAFCDLGGRQQHATDSRHEFLGRNGNTAWPAGLRTPDEWSVSNLPGRDPCCAFAVTVELPPRGSAELQCVMGQAADADSARHLVLEYRKVKAEAVLHDVHAHWNALLGTVQISTPDAGLDILFNRWLLYQTIGCRLWGRAAFYQAGGAYGFRDQLQDGMALTLCAPLQVRAHLLRAAARQFLEGDVQHWWHPPSGRGVRTHFSDDRVWLPFAVHQYMDSTGDVSVLEEEVPFIEGPALPLEREDAHYVPSVSSTHGSLYEHCARALDRSLATGVHNLPLIGGGDWNDGMNRIGHAGKGESVWMAWFLITTLQCFLPIAQSRGDQQRVARWREHLDKLSMACEREAWDGQWYRRAFFDDGTPLGSSQNTECRIDSLSQSWAVLSGFADPARARAAMSAVEQQLIREEDGLVLLFTPPFDVAPVDPGYIKGYLPGLRENGGQYTHAAIWVLMAEAALGRSQQVGALLKMLNPVWRTTTMDAARQYRVEPYVLAADIYSGEGIAGRGGWTWYTGAAGWMYRAVLESVLGIRISGDTLRVAPCVPPDWQHFEVVLQLPGLDYVVRMTRGSVPEPSLRVDGSAFAGDAIALLRDGRHHAVEITLPQT